jgi:hypothetical protein
LLDLNKYACSLHELTRLVGEVLMEQLDIIEVLKLKFDKLKILKPYPYQMTLALKIEKESLDKLYQL